MAILAAVVSHPPAETKDSSNFGFEALKPALEGHTQFLEMLVTRLPSADHSLCVNALQLINALMRDAMLGNHDAEWHQFVQQLKTFGVITSVHYLMQETALQDLAHPLLEFQTLTKLMLRKWRETPIDLGKQEHRRALRAIHFAANPERKEKKEKETENEGDGHEEKKKNDIHKWRKLGFTAESPGSDFDQVGYLGLMDLQDFSKKSEDGFQRLLLEQQTKEPEYRCPIARACISVTSILYDHFEIDEADITDHQQYVALDSHSNFGKLFKPLLLQRSRLHTSGVKAFLRLWEATGAETEDFTKIEDLTRVLIEQVVTMAPRTREVTKVEEEIAGDWDLNRLRELQMELMEFSHEEAWGRHLRYVSFSTSPAQAHNK